MKTAFQDPYRATVQLGGTDPNKLHDPKADLDAQQVEDIGGAVRARR